MMRVGICGAHRVGKSTLARLLADRMALTMIDAGVSKVFAEMGLSPSSTLDASSRLSVQERILKKFEQVMSGGERVIIDRTPIDMVAYLLADMNQQHYQEAGVSERVMDYIKECFETARKALDFVIYVPPGIPLEQAEGKGLIDQGYIQATHWLMKSALADSGVRYGTMPTGMIDLETRCQWAESAICFHL
ncbi:AAA family ATPase [Aeromonas veronii]|uniref:AAA family ATPase n=1 Tax=Aeromonas veronii TaxID=654 RepID=UPI001E3C1400|nr:AAA family ATPase [Aeromonas veronii]MCD6618810.1 AAA family ATPase [Aeromonas veronii]